MVPNNHETIGILLYSTDEQRLHSSSSTEAFGGPLSFHRRELGAPCHHDNAVLRTNITSIGTPYGDFSMTLQYRQNVDFQVAQSPNDIIDSQLIIQDYAVHPRKPAQEGSQGHEQMRAAAASASPGRSRAQTLAHLAGSQPVGIPAAHQQPPRPSAYGGWVVFREMQE
ncbi:unnamed protein product [Heterosigma akashiwo]